jgi:hypothetical protein
MAVPISRTISFASSSISKIRPLSLLEYPGRYSFRLICYASDQWRVNTQLFLWTSAGGAGRVADLSYVPGYFSLSG